MNEVDNRAVPGTFEKTKDGFVRLDEATIPASAAGPDLGLDEALAIAEANEASGFPPPPQVQAVIDAHAEAAAEAKKAATKAEAEARRAASPSAQQSAKPATPAAETKE